MRVLAVDPAIRSSGYAIVERQTNHDIALDYGVIKVTPKIKQSQALAIQKAKLDELIAQWKPDQMAVESIIYVQSHRTAISMGSARACIMIAAAQCQIPLYQYAPKKVKQAVLGNGNANKNQVAFMVRALLKLKQNPPSDAADALAVAITHLAANPSKGNQLLTSEEI